MDRFFLAILLIPLLIGCGTQQPDVLPLASDSTASIADPQPPQPTAYPGPDRTTPHPATATASPKPAAPSPTPATPSTTTPLAGEDMDAGDPSPPPQTSSTPAEPASIHWKTVASKQGKLKELVGYSGTASFYNPSPDGRWRVVVGSLPDKSGGARPDYPLYVLDSEADDHWLAAELRGLTGWSFAWTEDGRLLWIDMDGRELYIANSDGSQRRELAAPEPAEHIRYGGASTALVAGQERFWRVDLEAATWDPVLDSDGQPVVVPDYNDTVTASPDGTFATLINTKGDVFRIPLATGEPAVQVTSFEIETMTTNAQISSVVPLANSPLWATGVRYDFSAGRHSRSGEAVFVDSTTGEFIPVTKFPPQGAPGNQPTVSPDGRWFAIRKQASATSAPDDRVLYIASSTDPYGGRVIDINVKRFADWVPEADLVLLITNEGDLVRLDLQTGSTQRLLESEVFPGEGAIFGGNETIFVMEGAVHAFTLEGHKLGELEALASPYFQTVAAHGTLMFVTEGKHDNDHRIWLWEPAP